MKVLIIGGVAAGTKTAAKLKREDRSAEVTVITKDKDISYVSAIGSDFLMLYGTNGEAIGFADPHGNITETSGLALSSVSESGYYISTDPATGKFGLLDSSLGEIFPDHHPGVVLNIIPQVGDAFSVDREHAAYLIASCKQ